MAEEKASGMKSTTGSDGSLSDRGGDSGMPQGKVGNVSGERKLGAESGGKSGEGRY